MTTDDIINNRYRLIRQLGRGSFGEVWLAEDNILGIEIAIKIYIALDSRGLEEFKSEFKNVRHLNHPNLLRPDYYDHSGNSPYLVMTYCPDTVGNKVGNMAEQEVWALIKDVSAGLEYLHKMDIVHRDIKPDNILKNDQGAYVISDFGLSQKMRSTLRRASARNNDNKDSMSGTVGYMAPEMFSSRPNAVKATDVWALGVTIYEVITGEMPFCGQGGVMELHGAELPELPQNYGAALSNLMHRCLAKDTWDRPTAKEINEIAHSFCPDENEVVANRQPVSKSDHEQYQKQINLLQAQLEKSKQEHGSADCDKIRKSNEWLRLSFWTTLSLLLAAIIFGLIYFNVKSSDYESRLNTTGNSLYAANETLDNIENICQNGVSDAQSTYPAWTSSNHNHNSWDYREYSLSGWHGDILRFDYKVDSESYDHFKASIVHNGNSVVLKEISGLNKNGSVSYELPDNGNYILLLEYRKDHSDSSGQDNAQVYNIELERSPIGVIANLINSYKEYVSVQNEEVVEEVAVEEVEAYPMIIDSVAE